MNRITVRMTDRGIVVIPKAVRERLGLRPGTSLDLLEIGGVLVLVPGTLRVDDAAERIRRLMRERGLGLADVIDEISRLRHEV